MDLAIVKKSRPEQVYDKLNRLLTGGGVAVGDRLAPMRELARRFDTSVPTVQRALDRLAEEGRVVRRQGSGTFVASSEAPLQMADSVILCGYTQGDVWGELTARLLHGLHERDRFASLIDMHHPRADEMVRRLSQSDAQCLVIHGSRFFPFEVFESTPLNGKRVVGIVDWESRRTFPGLVRVLTDYSVGARQAAAHLADLGHRRVLVLGTGSQAQLLLDGAPAATSPMQAGVRSALAEHGLAWQALGSHSGPDGMPLLDEERFLAAFRQDAPPTAVFAMRDLEALLAQRLMRRCMPRQQAEQIAIVGYFDTPWSLAGDPPITTVSLEVADLAAQVLDVLERLRGGGTVQDDVALVPQKLLVRGSSARSRT